MRKVNIRYEKNMNSIISYFFVLIMTFSIVFSTPVFAVENQSNEGVKFEFSNGQITKYTGTESEVIIPDTINGEIVTSIDDKAFYKKTLTSIKIPNTVENIGKQAFANNSLTSIGLPEKLTQMGDGAFSGNKLTSVRIPKGLKKLPNVAFSKNKLNSVIIPEGLETIGNGAFTINELEVVNIPDSVTFIDSNAFKQNKLKAVKISKNIKTIEKYVFDNNQLENLIIPESVIKIDDAAFRNNQLTSVIIPKNLEIIGNQAFEGNQNISFTYSKLVEAIKNAEGIEISGKSEKNVQALEDAIQIAKQLNSKGKATLTEVQESVDKVNATIKALAEEESIKPSIKEIKALEDIEVDLGTSEEDVRTKLPGKVTIIDSQNIEHNTDITWSILDYNKNIAGKYTATGTFEIPEGLVQSNPSTDLKVRLKITVKAEAVEDKGWNVKDFTYIGTAITGFSESGKEKFKTNKNLILPKFNEFGQSITEIGDKAFAGDYTTKQNHETGINSIKIPDTVITIGAEAFRYNSLTAIDIPSSVTTIKMSAFNGNKIKNLVIPDSVTKLEVGVFTLNEIETLKLPNSLTTIPTAFGFNNLTSVTIPEGVTRIDDLAFSDNRLNEIKLPSTLKYLSGLNNNEFRSITIPESVTELGKKSFASNWMTSVTIPGNVKIIGERAFWNTWHDQFLSSITIEEGVERIDPYAFCNNHLKDVELPSSLKQLHKDTFSSNLGYDGIVHVYTANYKNPNNFEENKYLLINPGKITAKYVFEDKVLKEKEIWKDHQTGSYLHIGDKGIEVVPEYSDNEYELKDTNSIKVDLKDKDNIVIIQCKKKDVIEKIRIKSIGKVPQVAVDFGTNKDVAMSKLTRKAFIIDSNNQEQEVNVTWSLEKYDGNKAGEYTAIGTFELPKGVFQSEPETKLEVISKILVKEKVPNLEDNQWKVEDFTYNGTIITGFSNSGKEKLKTNKDLILPKVNGEGKSITNIGENAFSNMGLASLTIPEGVNGLVVGAGAFRENQLKRVYIPEGVKEILTFAFFNNDLLYVDFPGTLNKVGNQAFANNKLVSATFAKGIGTICLDSFSFYNNKLKSITILKEVKKVHEEAFKNNEGYENDNNKVHIFLLKLNPENNGLFEFSDYHRIFPLTIESVEKINSMKVDFKTERNNIGLPEKIKLKLNNEDIKEVYVTWKCEDYNGNKAQEYTFVGSYDLPEGITGEKPAITVKVLVKDNSQQQDIPVTEIVLDKTQIFLNEGENIVLKAMVLPEKATNKKIIWSSSNKEVATVDETGKVTAIKEGLAMITAATEDGSKTATCETAVKIDECFIATAAYGSKFEPAVVLLRHFRDDYLLNNKFGKSFVEFYYKHSPPIAKFIAHSAVLKNIVKLLLTPFVLVVYGLYNPINAFICITLVILSIMILVKTKGKYYNKTQ